MPVGAREMLLIMRAQNLMTGELARAGAGIGALGDAGMTADQRLRSVGQGLQVVGGIMTAVGAAGVAFFASSVKAAVEYDNQVAYTQTQTRGLGISFQQLSDIGMRVANAIPVPFKTVQATLYDIFSTMNVNAQQAEMLETNFAKAAVAGQVDMQTAGRETMGVMNAFKIPVEDVSHVLDVQFQLVKDGAGTYQQFISHLGQVVPPAVAAGQSFEQLAADYAFSTREGMNTANAATSVARAMDQINKPDFQAGLQQLGINFLDAQGKAKPLNDIVTEIATNPAWQATVAKSGDVQSAFINTFGQGSIQARRFFDVAIPNYQDLNREVGNMNNSAGATAQAYDIMFKQPQSQIQLLKNHFQELQVTVGNILIPVLNDLIPKIEAVFKWFNDLPGPVKSAVVEIGAGVAVFTLVAGVAGILVGSLMQLRGAYLAIKGVAAVEEVAAGTRQLSLFAPEAEAAAGATSSLAGSLGGALLRAGPLILAVGALYEAWQYHNQGVSAANNALKDFRDHTQNTISSYNDLNAAIDKSNQVVHDNKVHWWDFENVLDGSATRMSKTAGTFEGVTNGLERIKGNVDALGNAFGLTGDEVISFAQKGGLTMHQLSQDNAPLLFRDRIEQIANGLIHTDQATQDWAKHVLDLSGDTNRTGIDIQNLQAGVAALGDKYKSVASDPALMAQAIHEATGKSAEDLWKWATSTGLSFESVVRVAKQHQDELIANLVKLPAELQKPAVDAMNLLSDSLNDGRPARVAGLVAQNIVKAYNELNKIPGMGDAAISLLEGALNAHKGQLDSASQGLVQKFEDNFKKMPPFLQQQGAQAMAELTAGLATGNQKMIQQGIQDLQTLERQFEGQAPQFGVAGQVIGTALQQQFLRVLNTLPPQAGAVIKRLGDIINELPPEFKAAGETAMMELTVALQRNQSPEAARLNAQEIVKAFDQIKTIPGMAQAVMNTVVDTIKTHSDLLPPAVKTVIGQIQQHFAEMPPPVQEDMIRMMANLATELQTGDPAAQKSAGAIVSAFNALGQIPGIGANAVAALAVQLAASAAVATAQQAARNIVTAFSQGINAHSPSRDFIQLGEWAIQGFIIGMTSQEQAAVSRAFDIARNVIGGAMGGTSGLSIGLSPFGMLGQLPHLGGGGGFGGTQPIIHIAEGAFKAEIAGPVTPEAVPDLEKMLDQKMDDFATTVYNKFRNNR